MPINLPSKHSGFTLIELLVVIGIIGILAGGVIMAISPSSQLISTRDSKRRAEIREIKNAIVQYLIDNGELPGDKTIPSGESSRMDICREGAGDTSSCLVLETDLVPEYLSAIPVDPNETDENLVGYAVYQTQGGFVEVTTEYLGQAPTGGTTGGSGGGGGTSTTEIVTAQTDAVTPSIAIASDGFPIIAHRDTVNNDVVTTKCADATCSSTTNTQHSTADVDGQLPSIDTIGGNPAQIAHFDSTTGQTVHSRCANADCTSFTDTTAIGSYTYPRMQLRSAGPTLSVIPSDNKFTFITCTNATCSLSTEREFALFATTITVRGDVVIPASELAIAVGSMTNNLVIGYCLNDACSSQQAAVINPVLDGSHISLVENTTGHATVLYTDSSSDTQVVYCTGKTNPDCSSVTIAGSGDCTQGDIAMGNDDLPIIACEGSGDLIVIKCSSENCSSYSSTTISTGDTDGVSPDIAIGADNLPVIVHTNTDNNDLVVTHCANESCT